MKHILVALSLLALCTQQITFAMETGDTWSEIELKNVDKKNREIIQTQSIDELVSTISAAIDKQYPTNFLGFFSTPLTEQNCLDIINIIFGYSENPSTALIDKLCTANKHYKHAIEHFLGIARANIHNITIYSLEKIQDPTQIPLNKQFLILNQLPAMIKKLIIERAYNNISHAYDIILTGHTDNINFFDICVATHQAATSSKDKTLRLWDLQTEKCVHTFPEDNADTIFRMTFNPDGSHLATAEHPDGYNIIKIWATKSAQLLHTIEHNARIVEFHYGQNNTLILRNNDDYNTHSDIKILSVNNNNVATITDITKKYREKSERNSDDLFLYYAYWNNMYKTETPRCNYGNSKLTVKKLNCRSLYLYYQAIHNTDCITSATQNLLTQQPLFKELTELEKNKITKSFLIKQQQTNNLLTKLAKQQLTNNLLINK
jgi:hypothetical protein